jgi:hypothetical protein
VDSQYKKLCVNESSNNFTVTRREKESQGVNDKRMSRLEVETVDPWRKDVDVAVNVRKIRTVEERAVRAFAINPLKTKHICFI